MCLCVGGGGGGARQPLNAMLPSKARCCKHSLRCSSPACRALCQPAQLIYKLLGAQTADLNGVCLAFARRQSAAQGWETEKAEIPRRAAVSAGLSMAMLLRWGV